MYPWILENKFQRVDFTTFIDKFRAKVKIWLPGTHAYYTLTFLSRNIHLWYAHVFSTWSWVHITICELKMNGVDIIIADTYKWVTKLQMSFLVLLINYVKWGKYSGKKTVMVCRLWRKHSWNYSELAWPQGRVSRDWLAPCFFFLLTIKIDT